MTDTDDDPRDVWVAQLERHVPAHRIPAHHVPAPGTDHQAYVIICPPLMAFGGTAITRSKARELEAFPCLKCFPAPAPAAAQP